MVITLLSQKGGAGKSTISIALAGEIHRQKKKVTIIDIDAQETSAKWSAVRAADEPCVVTSTNDKLEQHLSRARRKGHTVIIDTPGRGDKAAIEGTKHADLILIPARCSIADIEAIEPNINFANAMRKRHLVVINALRPNSIRKFEEISRYLASINANPAPVYLANRAVYTDCLWDGSTPQEFEGDKNGKATMEVAALYQNICARAGYLQPEVA